MNKHTCPWWLGYAIDNPFRRLLHDPEKILAPYVREGMTVADIGCGMGLFTITMARMVGDTGSVIAVDIQKEMLDALHRRAERVGVAQRIRIRHAADDDIRVTDPLDFALAFWMVHEVKDISKFFTQVAAALVQPGKILVVEPMVHVSRFRFQEILTHARAAGFRIGDAPPIRLSRARVLSKKL